MTLHLLIFGRGYSGSAVAQAAVAAGFGVSATSRDPDRLAPLAGVRMLRFEDAAEEVGVATHVLATAAPDAAGDPVLARYRAAIGDAPRLGWLGYLSTTGVYGDRGGGWVDETSAPAPGNERGRRRVAAEAAWRQAGVGRRVDLFRLAGIYGPGRSVLDDVRAGTARRVIKPGHAFGRIHRDDIAAAVVAAMAQPLAPGCRVFNLNDDEPAESAAVIEAAARLLGLPAPPAVPFAEAEVGMSAMGRSFWADNRKVSSVATRRALGIAWRYPTYREGLRGVLDEEAASS